VVDVLRIEERRAVEPALVDRRCERGSSRGELVVRDLHAATFALSIVRRRRTRSSTFGCVTKSAASPTSMHGLNGQSGSVGGHAVTQPELTAIADDVGPRPVASESGSPSGMR